MIARCIGLDRTYKSFFSSRLISISSLIPQLAQHMGSDIRDVNFVVCKDNIITNDCSMPAGQWLAESPRGAYTTCRTVQDGTMIFQLSFHINRLSQSALLMIENDKEKGVVVEDECMKSFVRALDPAELGPRVRESLKSAITAYKELNTNSQGKEFKPTILVTWNLETGVHVSVHITSLGPVPKPPIKVYVRGAPRHNAAAKDSEWVRLRKVYEDEKPDDVQEILLADGHCIAEGLSSNFFALTDDNTLYTAGQGVLMGSVREAVLRVAKRKEIPVVLESPSLDMLSSWQGAFLSSTSRLLLPIDELIVSRDENKDEYLNSSNNNGTVVSKTFRRTVAVGELVREVEKEVAAESESL